MAWLQTMVEASDGEPDEGGHMKLTGREHLQTTLTSGPGYPASPWASLQYDDCSAEFGNVFRLVGRPVEPRCVCVWADRWGRRMGAQFGVIRLTLTIPPPYTRPGAPRFCSAHTFAMPFK
ncbi:hypothetical protein E2C01_069077 [Portunus trituberculatus]|uniref:Uncharacterized protein n=1 Tax=Portunus trituberculatus TaxID=210409 RepID=A0A5B7HXM4_PORTR|nr:hypothetical protein [Portunus trituberculatus]